MSVKWSASSQRDLFRLRAFLATDDPVVANRVVRDIITRTHDLSQFPELGIRLERFGSRDVRRLIVGDYEVRYEVAKTGTSVLRVWHTKEDR